MTARDAGRLLLVPVWAVVLALLVIAGEHVFAFDRSRVFMAADAYTLWLYLPAYPIAVAAAAFRNWLLTVAAGVLVAAHLVWIVTPVLQTVPITAAARRAPHLVVVSANLDFQNAPVNQAPLVDELADYRADVVVLEEVTPSWWRAITAGGLLSRYRHYEYETRFDAGGMAMLSRLPLTDVVVDESGGWPIITAAVDVGGTTVHLAGVHLVAPINFDRNQYQQRAITAIVRALPKPRVVAGDFNASPYSRWFQQLLGLGLREAHDAVGRPFATTWPNGTHHDIPPLRLDHVFADPPIVPLSASEGHGQGSDHRPIIVDLAIVHPG